MNGIKRFFLILFGLAASLCLAALALPWIGPFQRQATALMSNPTYFMAVQAVLAITLAGVLVELVRGLLTPRQRKTVAISHENGDEITVTTAAISSQAAHVVESDGRFVAERVRVSAKRKGVRVNVRVRPRRTVDISREGPLMHDALLSGLSTICGDKVDRVNIEFVEAENTEPARTLASESDLEVPASVYERATEAQNVSAHADEITVPVKRVGIEAADPEYVIEAELIEGE